MTVHCEVAVIKVVPRIVYSSLKLYYASRIFLFPRIFFMRKRGLTMDNIRISDITMKQTGKEFSLSFKEKLEIPKLLDKLEVSVIELDGIEQPKIDALRIKSVASTVKNRCAEDGTSEPGACG